MDERGDGAVLELHGKTAFSTDSFLVSPIFFPGGNIGELAVNGTVNDLSMCGATPNYISLSFIIEEGLPMTEFWEVLVGIRHAADKADVTIVTGDTKVVEKGKGDKLFINTSGIGMVHPNASLGISHIKEGDKIIVSGPIAAHGMAIMSVREGLEFQTEIVSDTTNLNHTVYALLEAFGNGIHLLTDPTRGGIATVLKETALRSGHGISLEQRDIPIGPQVASACEILGLDPVYVANEGIFIGFVDASIAGDLVTTLRSLEHGENASIIGEVVSEHPKQVVMTSSIGGKRMISMLPGEQLPRIC